ncbi:MAG: DUF2004 domain-containing protein [Hellea sp.]
MDEKAKTALAKIKSLHGTPEDEFGTTLFVSHHLEEISKADWLKVLKTETPTSEQILDALILIGAWSSSDDDVIDTYDFSLPDNLTNYPLSACFSEDDKNIEVSMES